MERIEQDSSIFKRITNAIIAHYPLIIAALSLLFLLFSIVFNNVYFDFFGVDYFYYSSFSDVYQVPLEKGALTLMWLLALLVLFVVRAAFFVFKLFMQEKPQHKQIYIGLLILIIFVFLTLGIINVFFNAPKIAANLIIKGVSPRYDIALKNNKKLSCMSIIGGSSYNLFIYDYSTKDTIIINKSEVVKIRSLLRQPPKFIPHRVNSQSKEEYEDALNIIHDKRVDWSENLKLKCNQIVLLPRTLIRE